MDISLTNRVNGETTYVTEGNPTFCSLPGIYAGRSSTRWNTTPINVYPIFTYSMSALQGLENDSINKEELRNIILNIHE